MKNVAFSVLSMVSLVLASSSAALAEKRFDNQGIQFEKDTTIEFEFVQSRGAYQSSFGVLNVSTGEKTDLLSEVKPSDNSEMTSSKSRDFLGTPGNAVPAPFSRFLFKANTPYSFYLESSYKNKPAGIVFSNDRLNQSANKQTRLDQGLDGLKNQTGITLRWNDTGSAMVTPAQDDNDFNDFVVIAGGFKGCPCRQDPSYPKTVPAPAPVVQPVEVPVVRPAPIPQKF